jgi:hypothetical protein
MELPRTARKPVEVDVEAVLPNGTDYVPDGMSFALCDHGGPTEATVWADAATYDHPTAVVILAGPDAADKTGALAPVTARPELWALPQVTGGQADPGFVETIEVL